MKTVIFSIVLFFVASSLSADTIKFKNGYEIYGKVVKDSKTLHNIKAGNIRILFKNGGWMDVAKKSVETITENDLDQFEMRENENKQK